MPASAARWSGRTKAREDVAPLGGEVISVVNLCHPVSGGGTKTFQNRATIKPRGRVVAVGVGDKAGEGRESAAGPFPDIAPAECRGSHGSAFPFRLGRQAASGPGAPSLRFVPGEVDGNRIIEAADHGPGLREILEIGERGQGCSGAHEIGTGWRRIGGLDADISCAAGDFERAIEEIAAEKAGSLTVAKIDVDANPATARDYQVVSIPTLILFKNGEAVKRIVGAKGKAALLREIADDL